MEPFRKPAKTVPLRVTASERGVGYRVGGKGFRLGNGADGAVRRTLLPEVRTTGWLR